MTIRLDPTSILLGIVLSAAVSGFAQNADAKPSFAPSGDIRIRGEEDLRDDVDRFRGRMRLRAGFRSEVLTGWEGGFRMAATASPDDPNSTHVNMNSGFNQLSLALDRVYLRWSPPAVPPLQLWLGKFANPFLNPSIYPELAWDGDIMPEGLAAVLEQKRDGSMKRWGVAGGAYFPSQISTGDEPVLQAGQAYAQVDLGPAQFTAGAGVFWFSNVKGLPDSASGFDRNAGNQLAGPDNHYPSDFRILDDFIEFKFAALPLPVTVKGELLYNVGADSDNLGYVAGIAAGRSGRPGDLSAYYQFQSIEREAVLSPFAQDDFQRQSGFMGHVFGVQVSLSSKLGLHAWGLLDSPENGPSDWRQRYRMDLNAAI